MPPVPPAAGCNLCRSYIVPEQDGAEHSHLHLRCKVQLGASAPASGDQGWATKVGDQDRTARNWKYALIRCLRSVWMGSSPSRKLKNAIGKCASGSTPYCAQRPNRQQPGPQVAGARARGRLLCWKPITGASDHAQKLTVSPELLVVLWSPAL